MTSINMSKVQVIDIMQDGRPIGFLNMNGDSVHLNLEANEFEKCRSNHIEADRDIFVGGWWNLKKPKAEDGPLGDGLLDQVAKILVSRGMKKNEVGDAIANNEQDLWDKYIGPMLDCIQGEIEHD